MLSYFQCLCNNSFAWLSLHNKCTAAEVFEYCLVQRHHHRMNEYRPYLLRCEPAHLNSFDLVKPVMSDKLTDV